MTDAIAAEGLLRGIAIGGIGSIGLTFLADRPTTPTRWLGVAFCASAIGHVLDNWSVLHSPETHPYLITWILSALAPGLFWEFAIMLFDDNRKFTWNLIVLPALSLAVSLLAPHFRMQLERPMLLSYDFLSAGLVAHAMIVVWSGWRGDLVEHRRRLRLVVTVAVATYVLVIAAGEGATLLRLWGGPSPLMQALTLAALGVAGAAALLRVDSIVLGAPTPRLPSAALTPKPVIGLDSIDKFALERLANFMDEEQIWRKPELSIGSLAALMAIPEHRLRRLINRELGHRNFAAFVNVRRIQAAKDELDDPRLGSKPVSSVAYELGFGSLGPFNRAFKEATGVTPTEWRRRKNAIVSPKPNNSD